MSAQVAASGSGTARSRPTTRSYIRQSLGKAFADVMHKDAADKEKEKSTKTARRGSAIHIGPTLSSRSDKPASAISSTSKKGEMGDTVSPETKEKTATRSSKRLAALKKPVATSSDERSSSSAGMLAPKPGLPRSSTLRPKASAATSALPKYRPRSLVGGSASGKQSPSQSVRTRSPARSSDSSDETDDVRKNINSRVLRPSPNAANRSVSPVPHKGALQVDLSTAIRVSPATPDHKSNHSTPIHTPSPQHASLRAKAHKPLPSVSGARIAIPRPPSSSSSSASPQTPKSMKTVSAPSTGHGRSGSTAGKEYSPVRGLPRGPPESPLGRITERRAAKGTPASRLQHASSSSAPSTSQSADDSMDSLEAHDVEFMLSTVISPTAPTPALPRFRTIAPSDADSPQTPSRSFLPSRANLSYLSPAPPSADNSPFLRPLSMHGADRGSILSWEQLAKHSKEYGGDDVLHMISEVPAPFRSGAVSPSPSASALEIPDSPMLSALPSPTSYGSISQVLLPDVTPSPALHTATLNYSKLDEELSMHNDAVVMQLRLQLAAAENKARDRLGEIESLESQLRSAKEARLLDADELAKQISSLEERVHGNLRLDEGRLEYISSLEGQLRNAHAQRDHAIQEVKAQQQALMQNAVAHAIRGLGMKFSLANAAHEARASWQSVRDAAESELELIHANREMLAVLLSGLAPNQL